MSDTAAQDAIRKMIGELTEKSYDGEVIGLAFVAVAKNGTPVIGVAGENKAMMMLFGGIALLQYQAAKLVVSDGSPNP